jgi:hypothetical protein
MSGGGRSGTTPAIAGKAPRDVIDPKWLKQSHFLHRVPIIMEKEGWKEGAAFQKLWFSLPARRRTEANVRSLFVDDRTIKMKWVLGFDRAKAVYEKLLREAVSGALWEGKQFIRILAAAEKAAPQQSQLPAPGQQSHAIPFPPVADPLKKLTQWKLLDWAASDPSKCSVGGMSFDGLLAALGRFAFYAVPVGTATKLDAKSYSVHLEKIGVFVHDSFDFNDDHSAATDAADPVACEKRPEERAWGAVKAWTCSQPLGVWNLKEGKLLNPSSNKYRIWLKVGYTLGHGSVEKKQRDDMARDPLAQADEDIYIGNATYRTYRQKTGHGGDFIIFSDVQEVPIGKTVAAPISP